MVRVKNSDLYQVGDVWEAPSGLLRIARYVRNSSKGHPRRTRIEFTIQRCSWTGRSITCYSVGELLTIGYRRVGRVAVKDKFQKLFYEDCQCPPKDKQHFTCCDVKGIP